MNATTTPRRPDLEDLTAFVEGRLAGDDRRAVVERLDSDADYYELYVDLLRFLDEEDGAGVDDAADDPRPPAPVIPHPSWRRRWYLAGGGLAAAALLALVLAPGLFGPPTVDDLVAPLGGEARTLAAESPEPAYRSVDSGHRAPLGTEDLLARERESAFLLGAMLVDLRLAEPGGQLARDRFDRIRALVPQLPELESRRSGSNLPANVGAFVDELTAEAPVAEPYLRLGLWTRAAWLAAESGDAAFFDSWRRRPPRNVPDEAERLRRIQDAVADGDLETAASELRELADDHGGAFYPPFASGDESSGDEPSPGQP